MRATDGDAALAAAVTPLLDAAEAVDGARAVSEHAELALRSGAAGWTHLVDDDGAAYASLERSDHGPVVVEAVVAPDHRGRGLGAELVAAVLDAVDGDVLAWAHGDHPAAAALAARHGFVRARELLQLDRPLAGGLPDVELPDDVVLRAFRPGEDDAAWLAVNAAAFAHHPEQGAWTQADLDARTGEPWFDAAGFLLAVDAGTGELLGSHWTKVHPSSADGPAVGEVYVVSVAPAAQGRRLGRAVTLAGLHHLRDAGLGSVLLYVEASEERPLRMYRGLGFTTARTDVQYARP